MGMNGSKILIAVNTASEGSPNYTAIPCQTSGEYALAVDTIDTSCKDSADDTNLPGARSRTVSVETRLAAWPDIVASPSGAAQVVRKAAETGEQVQGAIVVDAATVETFTATITSLTISAPREDDTTLSMDLAISGATSPQS